MNNAFEKQKESETLLDLMNVDYSEIDRQLLPPSAFRNAKIAPISDVAPPQGSPFLREVSSMYKILNKMPFAYRDK
jgi:hypothetical protein